MQIAATPREDLRRAVSWPVSCCDRLARDTVGRDRRRSAGTDGVAPRTRASELHAGGSARRRRGSAGPARSDLRPAAETSDRNSSSTRPGGEQLVRSGAGPPSHSSVRTCKRSCSSASAAARSSSSSRRARTYSTLGRGRAGQALRRGGQDDDAGVGVGQQRQIRASARGSRRRCRRAARSRGRARRAGGGGRDRGRSASVALGAHGARAHHDAVHDRAQPVEQRAVGWAARSARAPCSVARPSSVLTMLSSTYGARGPVPASGTRRSARAGPDP